ncbi:MAG: hypothetical protein INH41_16545 [Myxococcaceae bacterium]|nr:hypothetical protein [Myxococcaceae bacterium]
MGGRCEALAAAREAPALGVTARAEDVVGGRCEALAAAREAPALGVTARAEDVVGGCCEAVASAREASALGVTARAEDVVGGRCEALAPFVTARAEDVVGGRCAALAAALGVTARAEDVVDGRREVRAASAPLLTACVEAAVAFDAPSARLSGFIPPGSPAPDGPPDAVGPGTLADSRDEVPRLAERAASGASPMARRFTSWVSAAAGLSTLADSRDEAPRLAGSAASGASPTARRFTSRVNAATSAGWAPPGGRRFFVSSSPACFASEPDVSVFTALAFDDARAMFDVLRHAAPQRTAPPRSAGEGLALRSLQTASVRRP